MNINEFNTLVQLKDWKSLRNSDELDTFFASEKLKNAVGLEYDFFENVIYHDELLKNDKFLFGRFSITGIFKLVKMVGFDENQWKEFVDFGLKLVSTKKN